MNLNNLNKKVLHSYTYGKLDLLSHELRKNLYEIIKKIGNLNDKIERLDEKVNNSDSRAIEVVNKKLDVVEEPGNRSNLIPGILAVIVLLVGTTFIENDGGLKGIVFFALIVPLVLLFSKIFSGSNEEKQKEYERYQKKYERLISIEKNKFKSSKYFKEILINKNKLDVLLKKKTKIDNILNDIPYLLERATERERTAKIAAYDNKARIGSETIRKDLLASTNNRNWKCPYCFQIKNLKYSQADHIHPVHKGGLTTLQNMALVCKPCNSKKKGLTLRVFSRKFNYDYNKICNRLEKIGKDV